MELECVRTSICTHANWKCVCVFFLLFKWLTRVALKAVWRWMIYSLWFFFRKSVIHLARKCWRNEISLLLIRSSFLAFACVCETHARFDTYKFRDISNLRCNFRWMRSIKQLFYYLFCLVLKYHPTNYCYWKTFD